MKKITIMMLMLLPLALQAQNELAHIRRKSYFTNVYQLSAKDAIEFQKWDSIPVQRFEDALIFKRFRTELLDEDSLPVGYYVFITVTGSYVEAEIFCKTNMVILPINNRKRLQLDVRTIKGEPVENATVYVGKKKAAFNKNSHTFWVKQLAFEEKNVIVYAPGDTLATTVSGLDEIYPGIREQRRKNFKRTLVYRVMSWVPRKVDALFAKRKPVRTGATGYVIFNKPKYKSLDTVHFKAYIIDRKKKQYNKTVNASFKYAARGNNKIVSIGKIKPISPGAFTGSFVLGDSIPTDIRCWLEFANNEQKMLVKEMFSLEEYVLDEIGTQIFTTDKETYYKNDSISFKASAKDANGLHVMDATARLVLKAEKIDSFFKDRMMIPDTLYNKEVKLETTKDNRFVIPADVIPAANISINATLIFKNSNNELQEKELDIKYLYYSRELVVKQNDDSLLVSFIEDGRGKPAKGTMEMNDLPEEHISYPFSIKINPLAEDYTFYVDTDTGDISNYHEIESYYRVGFARFSKMDTLGFILYNPYKIPVYYTVFNGDKVVATGNGDQAELIWKKLMTNRHRAYEVRWQYYWAGEERTGKETIGLLYKILNVNIGGKNKIFPGETDSLKVKITDFKGKPAASVNLTAVSYNSQFKEKARIKEPPYLVNYKFRNGLNRDEFEMDDVEDYILEASYPLGKNKNWINIFALDSMEYYKLLFPPGHYYDAMRYKKSALIPELAVHVVDDGMPQEIFLLYINNQLAYYNGVTAKMKYSFSVWPQNVKLGIRLKNCYIEIDSLYIQPNFKHDISFDINNLPAHSRKFERDAWWSLPEMSTIENAIMQVRNYNQNVSWIWQSDRMVTFPKGSSGSAIIGPFASGNYFNYFKENEFDIRVAFEPGYEYTFSKQVSRLEKKSLFPQKQNKYYLNTGKNIGLVLGDTVPEIPTIKYPKPVKPKNPLLLAKDAYRFNNHYLRNGMGRIVLDYHRDTVLQYIIIQSLDNKTDTIVIPYASGAINSLEPGMYNVFLVDRNDNVHTVSAIQVGENMRSCVKVPSLLFERNHPLIKRLQEKADSFYNAKLEMASRALPDIVTPKPQATVNYYSYDPARKGSRVISGNVFDVNGKGIPFASVVIKGGPGVQTDVNGNYSIRVIAGDILMISQTAYERVNVPVGSLNVINVALRISENTIAEVVVTSAFNTKRTARSVSANAQIVSAEELTTIGFNNALAGKVSGINVQASPNYFAGTDIRLRGENLPGASDIIYVVDGILYDHPQDIDANMIADINTLSGAEAIAVYGVRAANGVVVITTKHKTSRKEFRDYAFWEPNFFTDKNGEASVKVTYPDNITSWKTFVVGIDKKNRIGKASIVTQSYKPMLAQLNLPLFLIEGDTSSYITKSINYTPDVYSLKSVFITNGQANAEKQFDLKGNDAIVEEQPVIALGDTLTTSFAISSSTGFKDMEERKIPVYKKGMEQSLGIFNVLDKDTTVAFAAQHSNGELNIYAQNNTFDLLIAELDNLKKYPYFCVEQMTSKFRGLAMEKTIRAAMKQPFKAQKEMDALLSKIQKAQKFDGGWPWWEAGEPDLRVSNYITAALLPMKDDPLVASNIRNGLLYLQNRLPYINRDEMLSVLTTLSEAGHEMNYISWLNKVKFDSLTQQQQWQWVKIMQQQKQDYQKQLNSLMGKKIQTMLGGTHWGVSNYLWYSNEIATTIVAMEVLKKEPGMETVVNSIIQYFLEMKKGGYWRNTVETASILYSVLPVLLNNQKDFNTAATLRISGDTSIVINKFPYQATMNTTSVKNINIKKQGGGMVYFTAYQTWFNANPEPDNKQFIVQTRFEKNGKKVEQIQSGTKIKMIVSITVLKDADYVMITMPIPAGCIFTDKERFYFGSYKEYYKDRMIMYVEKLPKGNYNFEATLEPRYNGNYHLNPAKVELMYYPVFSGNNEMKQVIIKSQQN